MDVWALQVLCFKFYIIFGNKNDKLRGHGEQKEPDFLGKKKGVSKDMDQLKKKVPIQEHEEANSADRKKIWTSRYNRSNWSRSNCLNINKANAKAAQL